MSNIVRGYLALLLINKYININNWIGLLRWRRRYWEHNTSDSPFIWQCVHLFCHKACVCRTTDRRTDTRNYDCFTCCMRRAVKNCFSHFWMVGYDVSPLTCVVVLCRSVMMMIMIMMTNNRMQLMQVVTCQYTLTIVYAHHRFGQKSSGSQSRQCSPNHRSGRQLRQCYRVK